jgi:hypothetical protein
MIISSIQNDTPVRNAYPSFTLRMLILNSSTSHKNLPSVLTPLVYLIRTREHLLEGMKEPILGVNLCQCLQEIYANNPPLSGLGSHWIELLPEQECPAEKQEL